MKGFVLLELLVALVISVTALFALFALFAQTVVYNERAVKLFAATHATVNALEYACAHHGDLLAPTDPWLTITIISIYDVQQDGSLPGGVAANFTRSVHYQVKSSWTAADKKETLVLTSPKKQQEHLT